MASDRPLVLVLGATGHTGGSIVNGLVASGNFRVAALVRPASSSKPAAEALRASGVEIRVGDLFDGVEKLTSALAGVDVLISAVTAFVVEHQKDVFRAAKAAGVKRVVPCDFGTPGARGIRKLHDQKLAIRDFVKELGVPYTFIDVGWWMQLSLPLPERSKSFMKTASYEVYGSGDNRMLMTDLEHIGTYVARIVADPRTLNHAVMVWEDERTQLEMHEIGESISGEGDALKAKRVYVSAEEVEKRLAGFLEAEARNPEDFMAHVMVSSTEYQKSMHLLHENTLENAKRLGYLDAQELYPDIPKQTLVDFAKKFYAAEEPAVTYE
ncbi:NAD-P-binding protein [Cubamyces lactineus]|nr:NAD-P-binding protein [Cubamyces lactineus]